MGSLHFENPLKNMPLLIWYEISGGAHVAVDMLTATAAINKGRGRDISLTTNLVLWDK